MINFKNKKILAIILSSFFFILFLLPVLSNAALINCDGSTDKPCNFSAFISTINGIITWIISIATSIFTISAIYGGFLYLTSGDNPGNKAKAKSILSSTVIGFIIILVAWLIVYTIINIMAGDDQKSSILRFIKS